MILAFICIYLHSVLEQIGFISISQFYFDP